MKYAVALEGGGTKGAYHAGALKALQELEIEIEAITGTSIGSINAAYYIQEGSDALIDFWENIKPEQLIPEIYPTFIESLSTGSIHDYKALLKEVKQTIVGHGFDLSSFKKTLYDYVDESLIRSSKVDFGLVTYSISDFEDVQLMKSEIPDGKLIEYLIASSYLPGFKREKLSGKKFIDGAFYDNLPVNLLVNNGYKNVIAIELLGIGLKKKVKDPEAKIITISPSADTGRLVDFKEGLNLDNIQMGYYDTLRVFNEYYGQWFYLDNIWSPKQAYKFIDALKEDQVIGLAEILNIGRLPYKRCLYEKIIPKLMDLLHIPEEADYNMILLYILEYLGKKFEINRYRVMNMETLIELIIEHLNKESNETVNWNESIVKLLKTTKLYTHTFKDKVIILCAQMIMTGKVQGGQNGLQS